MLTPVCRSVDSSMLEVPDVLILVYWSVKSVEPRMLEVLDVLTPV